MCGGVWRCCSGVWRRGVEERSGGEEWRRERERKEESRMVVGMAAVLNMTG